MVVNCNGVEDGANFEFRNPDLENDKTLILLLLRIRKIRKTKCSTAPFLFFFPKVYKKKWRV